MLGRVLREPLLHFVALGALVFVVASLRSGESTRAADAHRIVVTAGDVQHLADGFTRTWQRAPTDAELRGLVAEWVRDEIYAREATALGLDRGDTVVRRRLRQKMEFLVEDAVAAPTPTDAELQAWLDAHPDDFRRDTDVSFEQVYVDRDRRGARAVDDARALVARLARSGPDFDFSGLGDRLMLPGDFDHVPLHEVAATFGDAFAAAVATLPISTWSGPIESGYGLHAVFVRNRKPGGPPPLAEVRDDVARAFSAERRRAMVDAAYAALRSRYEIVEEPMASAASPAR